jgi:hypothetical protein
MIPSRKLGCVITAVCFLGGGIIGTCLGFWTGSSAAPSQRISEEWVPGSNLAIQGTDFLVMAIKTVVGGLFGAAGGLMTAIISLNIVRRRA